LKRDFRLGGGGGAGAAESDRVRSDDAAREIEAFDEALAKLRVAELEDDSAVGALEAEVIERKGRLALTRRTLAEYEAQIEERRAALAQVIADEAEEAYRLGLRSPVNAAWQSFATQIT
jgi:hypothetical protein